MPHFIIDCSEKITKLKPAEEVMQLVFDAADTSGLFMKGDIKVRINPFQYFLLGEGKNDFIHVFGNIMEGRTSDQKADLSRRVVSALKKTFPDIPIISMNIRDFEQETYCNKSMV